jgi:hypothetical protein
MPSFINIINFTIPLHQFYNVSQQNEICSILNESIPTDKVFLSTKIEVIKCFCLNFKELMKKEFVIGRRLIKTQIISILRPIREKIERI